MRLLTLLRHAKSSWDDPGLADFERPLNKRGLRDAPRMAAHFDSTTASQPDLLVASDSQRTRETASFFLSLKKKPKKVTYEHKIYEASLDDLFSVIEAVSTDIQHLKIIGHNPGMTYLYNYWVTPALSNLPTCGLAQIRFDSDSWNNLAPLTGSLVQLQVPKEL